MCENMRSQVEKNLSVRGLDLTQLELFLSASGPGTAQLGDFLSSGTLSLRVGEGWPSMRLVIHTPTDGSAAQAYRLRCQPSQTPAVPGALPVVGASRPSHVRA